eukprot:s1218_g26.t1
MEDTAAVLVAALMVCAARLLCNAAILQLDGQEIKKLSRRQTPFKACRTRTCEGSDMDEVAWEAAMHVADLCARNSTHRPQLEKRLSAKRRIHTLDVLPSWADRCPRRILPRSRIALRSAARCPTLMSWHMRKGLFWTCGPHEPKPKLGLSWPLEHTCPQHPAQHDIA